MKLQKIFVYVRMSNKMHKQSKMFREDDAHSSLNSFAYYRYRKRERFSVLEGNQSPQSNSAESSRIWGSGTKSSAYLLHAEIF